MKRPQFLMFTLPIVLILAGCGGSEVVGAEKPVETGYDAALAAELGADEYGMRSYVHVVLKTGPKDAEITDPEKRKELFAGHFANMKKLAAEKKLVLSGPFSDENGKRGLYIFNVKTIEEAKPLVLTDPTVTAGIFTPEFTLYYGSAALMQINDIHQRIQKTKVE